MAINFAAEHMQGYNNPEIEIVNVEVSDSGEILTNITYNDIEKILARGVFPILSARGSAIRYILPLSLTYTNRIVFSTLTTTGDPSNLRWMGVGITFTPDSVNIVITPIIQK